MKAIALSGSPRQGNTEALLCKALEGCRKAGAKTELVLLREKSFSLCCGRSECFTENQCLKNDGFTSLYNGLRAANAWLLASPNYFNNVSALMKNFMDRTNPWCKPPQFKGKKAGLIVVGGGSLKSLSACEKVLRDFCRLHQMKVVDCLKVKAEKQNEVFQNSRALEKAFSLGEKLIEITKKS